MGLQEGLENSAKKAELGAGGGETPEEGAHGEGQKKIQHHSNAQV